ncbi:cysteine hydrolase family protein [Lysinibacter cavernae]|uniref:Nicotinamidase-related amidase n=1 Tax=Lysinibacter cavernae TaxID=1640652 RepID=A0A7X5TUK8_9MICO|nr:cysteine hydrolase family protein [Lysinibacter cavernae]NIH54488.1 nicotinamidase-related amidase [Lysinibacter cavernae]
MEISANAALIIIDVQQGFDDSTYWGTRNNREAEPNIAKLVEHWQATGRPIVMVTHASAHPESPLNPAHPGHALKPFLGSVEPALRISKTVNSSFYGTPDLDSWLNETGIEQVVLCGIQTNMCVETTARMAGNLGYQTVVALDACHTFDLAGPDGTTLTADELSRATATNLHGGGFAAILATNDLL